MVKRKIIEIDRDLCNGCGLCTTACAEGALALDSENKAFIVRELYCDGMGACLDVCNTGALTIVERDSEAYDVEATVDHVVQTRGPEAAKHVQSIDSRSALNQWPIQLHLISPTTPYFDRCDLLIAADCTAFACGGFHASFLKNKKLVIACPKLDNTSSYVKKLHALMALNTIYSITVVIMTVPCCSSLDKIVQDAVTLSGKAIAIKKVVMGLDGTILAV